MTRLRLWESILAVSVLVVAMWCLGTMADDQRNDSEPQPAEPEAADKDLSHFMHLKLEASGDVLEGLAVEDFDLIKKGARVMNRMSMEEQWRVTNDAVYRNFSDDFQRITKELVTAADEENLDRAALKWMDATMACIECHRYARGILVSIDEPFAEVSQ